MTITWVKFVIPRTKQIESRIFDLPVPFNPVIAVNSLSNGPISVRLPYDLKPSKIIVFTYILIFQTKIPFSFDWNKLIFLFTANLNCNLFIENSNCAASFSVRFSVVIFELWRLAKHTQVTASYGMSTFVQSNMVNGFPQNLLFFSYLDKRKKLPFT